VAEAPRKHFVGYCEGPGCMCPLYLTDAWVRSVEGLYCLHCWRGIAAEYDQHPPMIYPEWEGRTINS
jgi:hypothetical protein